MICPRHLRCRSRFQIVFAQVIHQIYSNPNDFDLLFTGTTDITLRD